MRPIEAISKVPDQALQLGFTDPSTVLATAVWIEVNAMVEIAKAKGQEIGSMSSEGESGKISTGDHWPSRKVCGMLRPLSKIKGQAVNAPPIATSQNELNPGRTTLKTPITVGINNNIRMARKASTYLTGFFRRLDFEWFFFR
jgi:hypothetical protein